MPFVAQPTEKCTACAKTVYATEKVVVDDKETSRVYHKTCIRCKECNKVLGLGQYSALEGVFYCKPHFKQIFSSKGNYDEAFGKEKATGKWAPQVVSPPASFLPEDKAEEKKDDKKASSAETVARFRKFREEGQEDKCQSCGKTVYAAEKLLVENKNEKQLFHKSCFRCSTCDMALDLRNYGSADGQIYCKNHLKDVTAINRPAASSATQPTSFIPATTTSEERKVQDKNETSEAVSAKFRKFREEGEQDKCQSCSKTVYAAEKLLVEDRTDKRLFHKTCFRCSVCDTTLDLRNYGSIEGVIYCKNHLKEKERERSGSAGPAYITRPASFVPETTTEKPAAKSSTPDHIAAKFKGLGSSEKCKSCGKSVYATEKITVEELTEKSVYHKNCLRCKICDVKLDLGSFGSVAGVVYCQVHLKQYGKPEQVRSENAVFISPLADRDSTYTPGTRQEDTVDQTDDNDARQSPQQSPIPERHSAPPVQVEEEEDTPAVSTPVSVADEPVPDPEGAAAVSESVAVSGGVSVEDRRDARQREREEEDRRFEEEKSQRERDREERRKAREEEDRREEEERERRKKEREERRRLQEEENRKEEEEMARRAEERKKRLEALKQEE